MNNKNTVRIKLFLNVEMSDQCLENFGIKKTGEYNHEKFMTKCATAVFTNNYRTMDEAVITNLNGEYGTPVYEEEE